MSNQQLYLAVGIPSLVAFMGLLTTLTTFVVTNQAINKRLDRMEEDMRAIKLTLDAIRQDMSEFRARLSAHDVEIANLKKQ